MLVLPLDFGLSLTHLHAIAFISEQWWEACGWWPHCHLESPPWVLWLGAATRNVLFLPDGSSDSSRICWRPQSSSSPASCVLPQAFKEHLFPRTLLLLHHHCWPETAPCPMAISQAFFFMLSQLMLWPPSSTFLHVFPPVAACKVLDVSLPWWRLSVTTPGSSTWGFFLGCLCLTLSSAVDSGADSHVNAELGHIPCGCVLWEGIAFSFGI